METVTVNASKTYSVLIGSNLLAQLGCHLAKIKTAGTAAIISDSNVWPLYGDAVVSSLQSQGFHTTHFTFPAGENSKNLDTYTQILQFLAANHVTRSDVIVALGGGVVGDVAGFAAATYLRGIDYIQIPTTLLSMVDSSVGGKTAIDLPAGKNLAGAFHQPILVLCDTDVLSTLPQPVFLDSCAEVIKYGILFDPELLRCLEENGLSFDREWVVARCVALKRDIVTEDEFENHQRQLLNLGHTIGHSIEHCSQYTIAHGQAVAIGIAMVTNAACKKNLCRLQDGVRILSVLKQFSLPVTTDFPAHLLFQAALSDKKRTANAVNMIIPERIGFCRIHSVPLTELQSFIEAGLQ